jgi:aryl-alcohol dehydrogenase-like predicted oxidoreductase
VCCPSRTRFVKHLEENVGAAEFKLTEDEFGELEAGVPKPYWLRG